MKKALLDFAKGYLRFGWSLIPIVPATKRPAVKWTEFQERRATLSEIEGWLKKGWHLAVVTGDISGVLVVDDDRTKHDLKEWNFDSPVIAKTQSGGKHYYFKYDREIHSHCNGELFIDLKAWHSYCLLPPFNKREWLKKPSENLKHLKPIPDEIVRLINSDSKKDSQGNQAPLEMADFISLPEGQRTNSLYKLAISIFNKLDKDSGLRVLTGVNQTYQPPLNKEEFDYQVSRAWKFVQDNPKTEVTSTVEVDLTPFKIKSGFKTIDETLGGFRSSGAYLVGGYEKSGKSSFLAKVALNMMAQGTKVGVLHTELPEAEINTMFAAVHRNETKNQVEDDDSGQAWRKEYKNLLVTKDHRELSSGPSGLNFASSLQRAKQMVADGCKVIIFDNLTTYYNLAGKDTWQFLGTCIQKVVDFSKTYNVISFMVVHQKPSALLSESPQHIRKLIQLGTPERIFDESVSVIKKPTGAEIYGGGASHSQLSGSIFIWRPFQLFTEEYLIRKSAVILENFGRAPSRMILMNFFGDKGIFMEGEEKPSFYAKPPTGEEIEKIFGAKFEKQEDLNVGGIND